MNAVEKRNFTDEVYKPLSIETYSTYISFTDEQLNNLLPSDRPISIRSLQILEELDDDWNGFGARKASTASVKKAKTFIELLPLPYFAPSRMRIGDEGSIVFIWDRGQKMFIVTIEPGLLHFSYDLEEQKNTIFKSDIPFDSISIPQELMKYIPKRDND